MNYIKINFKDNDFSEYFLIAGNTIEGYINDDSYVKDLNFYKNLNNDNKDQFLKIIKEIIIELVIIHLKLNSIVKDCKFDNFHDYTDYFNECVEVSFSTDEDIISDNFENLYIPLDDEYINQCTII